MDWYLNFDFYLFDLDGLLVDTEKLQYQAYRILLNDYGFDFHWNYQTFCFYSHKNSEAFAHALYENFPYLLERHPHYDDLRKEKNKIYEELLLKSRIDLMPGVESFLNSISEKEKCVVTNSTKIQTDEICFKQPKLKCIQHWITREKYSRPKPFPDGYLEAIKLYGSDKNKIIGFEDSLKGYLALSQTPALPIVISSLPHPDLQLLVDNAKIFGSFNELLSSKS